MKNSTSIFVSLSLYSLLVVNAQAGEKPHNVQLAPLPPANISLASDCPQGGTSNTFGSYEAGNGSLSVKTILTTCALNNGEVHDGTRETTGTLLLKGTVYDVQLDINESITVSSQHHNNTSVKHDCLINQSGQFDTRTNIFKGKESRQCANEGDLQKAGGIVGHVLKEAELGFMPSNGKQEFKSEPQWANNIRNYNTHLVQATWTMKGPLIQKH